MVQGEERGPFALNQVRTMYETGLVTPHTMFKYVEEWRPLVNAISKTWQPAQPPGRCFLRVRGEQRGPYLLDEVRTMWNEGQITSDTTCKLGEIWQPLARVLAMLAPQPQPVSEISEEQDQESLVVPKGHPPESAFGRWDEVGAQSHRRWFPQV